MTNKEKYRNYSNSHATIPIFSRAWWLDAVCGIDQWDVALVDEGGSIKASMPYFTKTILKRAILPMPSLTQTLGPYIEYPPNQKYEKKLAYEKKMMTLLIKGLPEYVFFDQNFSPTITNWLPFYWKGFSQSTRYTYIISDLTNEKTLLDNMKPETRSDIRKAEKQVSVEILDDIEAYFSINTLTFSRQGKKSPYSLDFLKKLDHACADRMVRRMFSAVDSQGNIHAVLYLVWDQESAYYLMGGADPEYRNSGASSLLIWEAIKFSATVTKSFNFEGSMIEAIESKFRSFGALQTPYFRIYKGVMPQASLMRRGVNKILRCLK